MRIAPNHPRLRAIALGCWALGAWWIIQIGLLSPAFFSTWMVVLMALAGALLLALGVAFWALGGDRRAGVVFDSKGLLLNLGNSASFVSWDNIERLGASSRRSSWLSIGSGAALGIRLRDPASYLQSYEVRLPASAGPVAQTLRLLQRLLTSVGTYDRGPGPADLARTRARTGYDVLVPEALLGGAAEAFVELTLQYRRDTVAKR
jgi:hypothetical protein